MVIRGMSESDMTLISESNLTPRQLRVREMMVEISMSTAPEISEYLKSITGCLLVRCIDSRHINRLFEQLAEAINTLDRINVESKA